MDERKSERAEIPALAWLVEFEGRSIVPGDTRHLTFVDASDPDYWGGEQPSGVTVTRLIAASDGTPVRGVLAWMVQHRPVRGRSRYLTFVGPTDPAFWNPNAVPGHAMFTPLVAADATTEPHVQAVRASGGQRSGEELAPSEILARETTDRVMNCFFENTSGVKLKERIRETIAEALSRHPGAPSHQPAPGRKVVPLVADDDMIYAACEASRILSRSAAKKVIEAAIMAAPDMMPPEGAVFVSDERAIAYKNAADEVRRQATLSANTGQPVSFADVADSILALHPTETPDGARSISFTGAPDQNLDECPNCRGPADNGHSREVPPSPYYCRRCSGHDTGEQPT